MKDDVTDGWGCVPAAEEWKCPECGETSPVEDWREIELGCGVCGTHDARQCPKCDEAYDHVWDDEILRDAQTK